MKRTAVGAFVPEEPNVYRYGTSRKDKRSGAKCCKRRFASSNISLLPSCENSMEPVDYKHFVPPGLVARP